MAGYWLRLIFAKRKNGSTRLIFSHLDRTSLVNKGLIIWPKRELFLAGQTREIPSGQDGLILPARVVNQKAGIASSCKLANSLIQQK